MNTPNPMLVKKNHDARIAAEKVNSNRRRVVVFTSVTKKENGK